MTAVFNDLFLRVLLFLMCHAVQVYVLNGYVHVALQPPSCLWSGLGHGDASLCWLDDGEVKYL